MEQTQRQQQAQTRREAREETISGMTPQARREFFLAWYAAADREANRAVREQRQHTAITPEHMIKFAEAQARFVSAAAQREMALEMMSQADQHEVLVRFPAREKSSLELETRLLRYAEQHNHLLNFGVTEWDDYCYHGIVTITLTPDALAQDGETLNIDTLVNGAIQAMCFDALGQVYGCQITPKSDAYIEARLTSVIGVEGEHAGNDVSDCAGSGDAQGVGAD